MPDFGIGEALAAIGTFFASDAAAAGVGLGAAELGADAAIGTGIGAGIGEAGLGIGAGFASDAAIAGGAGLGFGAGEAGLAAGTGLGLGAGFASDAAIAGGAGGAAAGLGEAGFTAGGLAAADLGSAGFAADFGGAGLAATPDIAATGGAAASAAPGLAATAPAAEAGLTAAPAVAGGAPAVASAPAAALPAFADPTSLAAAQGGSLFSGAVESAPAASAAVDPLAASEATFAPGAFNPASVGLGGADLSSPVTSGGGIGGWLSKTAGNVGDFVENHPLQAAGTGLSALGLGRSLLTSQNPNPIPGMSQLSQIASQLGSTGTGLINDNAASARGVASNAVNQGNVLQHYLTTGTLPPAIQSSLDQATKDGITNIRAQYAARGMPPGSSAEMQETNALRQRAVIQGGTIAAQLYQQGVSLDSLAANIYTNLTGTGGSLAGAGAGAQESLINTGVALNNGVNNSIANLSSALGGGSRAIINGQTVTLPQAA